MTAWILRGDPQPIDILMKNALSGIAWFLIAVINGTLIPDFEVKMGRDDMRVIRERERRWEIGMGACVGAL
jgi:hypothetical protein